MNDFINGVFEFSGGIFLWMNVWKLYQHKSVKGVSLWAFGFFAVWGYWNLYYYPCLNQWVSLIGSILVVAANTVWILLALKYRRNHGSKSE